MQRSVTLARRALALVDEVAEPRRAAWLYGMLQRGLWALLRQDEATGALERGLALLAGDGPSPERARLLARQAKTLMVQSRYHRAVRAARRALAEQADLDGSRRRDEVGALTALGVSLMSTGETEEGSAACRRALELARASGDLQDIASAAVNLSDAHHHTGAHGARRWRWRARRTRSSSRSPRARAGCRC